MNAQQPYRGPGTDNWVLSNGDTVGLSEWLIFSIMAMD